MICNKCNRVKLRAEESQIVWVEVNSNTMTALEDSQPSGEHMCRLKVGDVIDARDIGSVL